MSQNGVRMTVFLRGLHVYAFHGASLEEQTLGHRYLVSIEVEVPDTVGDSDSLSDTVDYGEMGAFATRLLQERKFTTVEAAATELAKSILSEFALLSQVSVELSKLMPPGGLIAESAGAWVMVVRGSDGKIGSWTE